MPTTPIADAVTIARLSVEAALSPLVATQQGDGLAVRLRYQRMPAAYTLPYVVHQAQDGGGLGDPFLDGAGWMGLWAVKVFATTITTADAWLSAIRGGMDSLSLPAGYSGLSIRADFERPLVIPPDGETWQAAALWRIRIYR